MDEARQSWLNLSLLQLDQKCFFQSILPFLNSILLEIITIVMNSIRSLLFSISDLFLQLTNSRGDGRISLSGPIGYLQVICVGLSNLYVRQDRNNGASQICLQILLE